MPTYTRFDDVTGLECYFNATEGTVNKTGDVVSSIDSVYGSASNGTMTATSAGAVDVTHNPTTIQLGSMAAFNVPTGDARLDGTLPSTLPFGTSQSVVVAFQPDSVSAGGYVFEVEGGTQIQLALTHLGSNHNMLVRGTTAHDFGVARALAPTVVAFTWDNGTEQLRAWVNGVETGALNNRVAGSQIIDTVTVGGSFGSTSLGFGGKVGLFAWYSRAITEQEALDLSTLATYWHQNGEAPAAYPPSGSFGVVETADDTEVTSWQWEESNDGSTWNPVGTLLTDTTGQGTTELTVNSAPLSANGTQVRCRAFYSGGSTLSNPATLNVH